MRRFVYGLVVGTGLGYVFHENIDRLLRTGLDKANERVNDGADKLPKQDQP